MTISLALASLGNRLTVRADESAIVVQDERLLLAQSWMLSDVGAQDAFELWERATQVRVNHYLKLAYPTAIFL